MNKELIYLFLLFWSNIYFAHSKKSKFSVSGTMGVTYDGYGLFSNPAMPTFFNPRRPWNLVRFSFQPLMNFGAVKIPFNINFHPWSVSCRPQRKKVTQFEMHLVPLLRLVYEFIFR